MRGKHKASSQAKYDTWAQEEISSLKTELSKANSEIANLSGVRAVNDQLRDELARQRLLADEGASDSFNSLKAEVMHERDVYARQKNRLSELLKILLSYIPEETPLWSVEHWDEVGKILGIDNYLDFTDPLGVEIKTRQRVRRAKKNIRRGFKDADRG